MKIINTDSTITDVPENVSLDRHSYEYVSLLETSIIERVESFYDEECVLPIRFPWGSNVPRPTITFESEEEDGVKYKGIIFQSDFGDKRPTVVLIPTNGDYKTSIFLEGIDLSVPDYYKVANEYILNRKQVVDFLFVANKENPHRPDLGNKLISSDDKVSLCSPYVEIPGHMKESRCTTIGADNAMRFSFMEVMSDPNVIAPKTIEYDPATPDTVDVINGLLTSYLNIDYGIEINEQTVKQVKIGFEHSSLFMIIFKMVDDTCVYFIGNRLEYGNIRWSVTKSKNSRGMDIVPVLYQKDILDMSVDILNGRPLHLGSLIRAVVVSSTVLYNKVENMRPSKEQLKTMDTKFNIVNISAKKPVIKIMRDLYEDILNGDV